MHPSTKELQKRQAFLYMWQHCNNKCKYFMNKASSHHRVAEKYAVTICNLSLKMSKLGHNFHIFNAFFSKITASSANFLEEIAYLECI